MNSNPISFSGVLSVIALLFTASVSVNLYGQSAQGQAMPVAVLIAEKSDVAIEYTYPARTVGSRYVEVRARVGGILQEKVYTEGQRVEKGDLLYRIDDERYQAAVQRAEAQLKMEEARLRKAQRDWARVKTLFTDKAVSQQNMDATLSEVELAEASVAAAKASLNEARIDLKYTEVRAEISGVTGLKEKDIGDLIGTSNDNSLLTTITQLDPIHIEFAVPDSEATMQRQLVSSGKIRVPADGKLRARLSLGSTGEYVQEGVLDFTDTRVDPSTGGVKARAVFPNPDHTLLPGQFVRVILTDIIRPDVFTVPQKAVMQLGEKPFVYVVEEGKAQFRPVTLAGPQGENWLIDSGLNGGEQIIVSNLIKIRPGAAVQPMPAEAAKDGSAQAAGE